MNFDSFYVDVLKSTLVEGIVERSTRILVVCGGETDRMSLESLGFCNFVISNIEDEKKADAENLPYEDGSFDCVIVHSGLHHCASPHRALLEMYRVSKKSLILFEPAQNLATRLGRVLGIGQTYEFAAVVAHKLQAGGWRNSAVPNWVYRFNKTEIQQTINCAHPFGPHKYKFFFRTRVPWGALRQKRNKIPLVIAFFAAPILRFFDFFGGLFSNNLAAIVIKPNLPDELFPWLSANPPHFESNPAWYRQKGFGFLTDVLR
jgi:SAM-dependent methyltransferase